ncbi:MAG: UDP-N-acetylglucosamine--N-acetylmuramyl-(pentapeptide) pyrophosphoryl-undecaprenol N-acetylglucosamine transferase [Candidatus Blackburnbacteria bacterium]|nr:UDP-N-acetylglucosamine--N-acetylmuramyl-(pentapeptide) pyrophosphoryl-undecaprenol N-acetylglucosamine transferase [Candidatus Blackburnbacteria bacterium]
MLKIVITGGHATPALVVAETLRERGHKIYWFGEKRAHYGKSAPTLEYQIIPAMGIPFYSVISAKAHRGNFLKTLFSLWKLPVGLIHSLFMLLAVRPDVVLSFGSYVAVPVAVAAYILGIPVVTHEQTAVLGLANKIVGFFSKKIAVTFPASSRDFPPQKIVITGNPIRGGFFKAGKKGRRGKLVLFITGGSRGAQPVNKAVSEILPVLTKTYMVYHQVGLLDFDELAKKKDTSYQVVANYTPEKFEERLKCADLVVSRAGANTVLEIASVGVPAILVPIPWARGDEQSQNAKALADTGLALVLPEKELSGETLLSKIKYVTAHLKEFASCAVNAQNLSSPQASRKVADLVEEVAGGR